MKDINMYVSKHDDRAKLGYIDKSDVDYESKFEFDDKSKQFIWSMDCGKNISMTDINLVDNPSDTRFDVYQDIWLEIYIEHEEYDANDYLVDITGMAYTRILICVAVDVDFASAQAIIERTLF